MLLDIQPDSSILCIHFSSKNCAVSQYDKYPTPAYVSNLYINPADDFWYTNGVGCLGKNLEESIISVKEMVDRYRFSNVVCIGSSMGAYGALLFASGLKCDLICFNPELFLNSHSGISKKDKINSLSRNYMQGVKRCFFVTDILNPSDTLSVLTVNGFLELSEVLALSCGSDVIHYLKAKGCLANLISGFISHEKCDIFSDFSLVSNVNISSSSQVFLESDIHDYCFSIWPLIKTFHKLILIEHLYSRKSINLSYKLITDFINEHGDLPEAVFKKAKILRRLSKYKESLDLFFLLESFPEYRLQGFWGQSMIHEINGDFPKAQIAYKRIMSESVKAPIVKESRRLYEKNELAALASKLTLAPSHNLLLTTYPKHKSKNVGDSMISASALKILQKYNSEFNFFTLFREEPLDIYLDGSIQSIIAPGFSVSNNVYPELFRLYSDLSRLPVFFPIGCSFQHPTASLQSFLEYKYNNETLDFLKFVVSKSGPLPCRDQLIVDLLSRHSIPAIYSGDLVLFDPVFINNRFVPPASIKSIVFTVQHHAKYFEQSLEVLDLINRLYPDACKYVSMHSKPNNCSLKVVKYAVGIGFDLLDLYGESKNLDAYNGMDLHVGYRLHGHISFLRRRKPSILMVEDARSYGFSRTSGTSYGCLDAYDEVNDRVSLSAVRELESFLAGQSISCFEGFKSVFNFIDQTYTDFILPYFKKISNSIN
jgi:hypothetical protein